VFESIMHWWFSATFLSLMAGEGHYGRVHLEMVRRFDSRAAIQLYWLGSLYQQMRRADPLVYKAFTWTPNQLKHYLGVRADMRLGNFKDRLVNPAIAKIKATGAFDHRLTRHCTRKIVAGAAVGRTRSP
jgi:hypothetical protein